MTEVWRPVVGFEESYEVSSLGRVKSLDKWVKHKCGYALKKGRIRVQNIHPKTGYCFLSLWGKRKNYNCLIHRLVAMAFQDICGKYFDGAEVDHINGVRTDNRAENLKWCTKHENRMNPITRKRYSLMNKGRIRTKPAWNKGKKLPYLSGEKSSRSKPIKQYSQDGILLKIWVNITSARKELGISNSSIMRCLKGETKTSKGFIWKYKEEK